MVLLLFDEVAVTLVDSCNYGIPFSLPKAIVRRYVLRSIIIIINYDSAVSVTMFEKYVLGRI